MTVKVPIIHQSSGVNHQKSIIVIQDISFAWIERYFFEDLLFYLWEKIPNIVKNWCVFSQHTPNEIFLIHQILNSSRPKVY